MPPVCHTARWWDQGGFVYVTPGKCSQMCGGIGTAACGIGCLGFQRRNNSPKLCVMGRAVGVQLCNWVCVTRVREAWMKGLYLWSIIASEGAVRRVRL